MGFNISIREGDKTTAYANEETLEKAKQTALAMSRQKPGITYAIHDGKTVHFHARDGQLLDKDGNPLK